MSGGVYWISGTLDCDFCQKKNVGFQYFQEGEVSSQKRGQRWWLYFLTESGFLEKSFHFSFKLKKWHSFHKKSSTSEKAGTSYSPQKKKKQYFFLLSFDCPLGSSHLDLLKSKFLFPENFTNKSDVALVAFFGWSIFSLISQKLQLETVWHFPFLQVLLRRTELNWWKKLFFQT